MPLMSDLTGYVVSGHDAGGCGLIQQHGNFPRAGQNLDEPNNNFEASVHAGYTATGQFVFRSAKVSAGQSVLFDLILDSATATVIADNVRVP